MDKVGQNTTEKGWLDGGKTSKQDGKPSEKISEVEVEAAISKIKRGKAAGTEVGYIDGSGRFRYMVKTACEDNILSG